MPTTDKRLRRKPNPQHKLSTSSCKRLARVLCLQRPPQSRAPISMLRLRPADGRGKFGKKLPRRQCQEMKREAERYNNLHEAP
jgi:hypothetical protein